MEKEIWRPVKRFEGIYEVSNLGNIRTVERFFDRKHKNGKITKVKKASRIRKLTDNGRGYLNLNLSDAKHHYVHRLVAEAFLDKVKGKDVVNHIDGNKKNNHVNNLEWCTSKENSKHAVDNKLLKFKGEDNPMAKLTQDDVEYIRSSYIPWDKEFGCGPLAEKFGVSRALISLIHLRKVWNY